MSKIYVTGDIHLNIDIHKLNTKNFPEQKELTKDDYVIICGDTGLTLDKSNEVKHWIDWLNEKNFTTLFVCGNHENFDILYSLPVEEWKSGKVHKIADSVIHLMRGQIFNINGKKIFTMGGANSIDKYRRVEGVTWWKEELPNINEMNEAIENLAKHNDKVDYIITHDCSQKMLDKLGITWLNGAESFHRFLDFIEDNISFNHWYFGHHHLDRDVDDKHTVLFDEVRRIL